MPAFGFKGDASKKDEGGILGGITKALGFITPADAIAKVASRDLSATAADKLTGTDNTIARNAGSALDFVRPDKVLPAFVGAGIQQARALPTMGATLAAGGDLNRLKEIGESPVGFAIDTENIRKQAALANSGNTGITGAADQFNAFLGSLSPVAQNVQQSFAETGLRGGAAVGSGITQTGLAGPRISPNEAAELIGVPSYGQAAQEGNLGAMVLGDVLNVAPALKGAGYSGRINPLANTATGARIAEAGAALEAAPLAPYSVPAKGAYNAAKRASFQGTAFPQLAAVAEKGIPVVSKAAAVPEAAAQFVGEKWAGAAQRGELMAQEGIVNRQAEFALPRAELQANIEGVLKEQGPAALETPEMQRMLGEYETVTNAAKAEAETRAIRNLTERADKMATELGVAPEKLKPTTALGKVIEDIDQDFARQGSFEGMGPAANSYDIVKNVPATWTDDYIRSSFKGLDPPPLPEGLAGKALQGYDTFMKAWKDQVLALRPAWHATNIVGNAMGAMLMGEVSPIWFAQNAGRIFKEMESPGELRGVAMGRGIGAEELTRNIGDIPKPGARGLYRRAVEKSYKINQGVDDFMHTAVALHQLDKLTAAGVPIQQAMTMADDFSLKTMGDFGNMSAAERKFLRRVSPFYPWYKHQAKATFRFPMENPGRFLQAQAWANRLTPGQETPQGAEFLQRFTPLGGGQFLSVGGDIGVGDPTSSPILNPAMAVGALSPAVQLPLAAAGFDPRKGGELQAAPGQGFGSAAKGYLTNQVATAKLGADLYDQLRGEGGMVRGSTRAPIVSDGRPIADSKVGGPLLPFLTGVSVQEPDLKGAKKRSQKAEKTEAKKAKNYEKAVKKKPKK